MNQVLKSPFRLFVLIACICIAVVAQSCKPATKTTKAPTHLPPGQAKKITGSQSAKEYAPGQTKKTTPSQSSNKSVPPGQAKKADGKQSAKEEAPGQQKKKK